MIKIESLNNEKIKYLRKFKSKKFRDSENCFLIENLRVIHDAIKDDFLPTQLFLTEELIDSQDKKTKFIIEKVEDFFVIDERINKSFSSLSTPSGICAIFEKQETKLEIDETVIYLNAINDPGNLGTILRTALAFDIKNFIVDEKCADIYNPKTISAMREAIFKINLIHDKDFNFLKKIKNKKKIFATRLEESVDVRKKIDLMGGSCIVFGNEANGISDKIIELADEFVRINISDKIESLNVAISAGIIFWEISKNKIK